MADEIKLQFDVDGPPDYVMGQWRTSPPRALRDEGYEVADESYNAITYEHRYIDWPMKIIVVTTLGFALLFRGFLESVFRVTARFDEQGTRTRILLNGTAHPRTRAALQQLADSNGGVTGPPTPSAASTLLPGSPPS